jgi:serine/threonine-protein kinase HipA
MSSDHDQAFVWVWLPGRSEPVVAGRLDLVGDVVTFIYGRSYLERPERVPLFLPELPFGDATLYPLDGMRAPGCIADSSPDSWGQRVVLRRLGAEAAEQVGLLTYLLESGTDRFGALDFQASPTVYEPRITHAPLEELLTAADLMEAGLPLSPDLELALLHGSSLGGARPKALLTGPDGRKLIAKFAQRSDTYPVVNAEGVAMDLARRAGLHVAPAEVVHCLDSDVLLVDRFDRSASEGERRLTVSALTILQLDERWARYATYSGLAEAIRLRFTDAASTLRELFSRIAFNICVGNTDDHARNHAAFWDGQAERLTLTPAYDVCPQQRSTGEASQAMAYGPGGERRSRLALLVDGAHLYLLERGEAQEIVDRVVAVIRAEWSDAADQARLTQADRDLLWESQILNPSIFYAG